AFGYGYEGLGTNLPDMEGATVTLYVRTRFTLGDPAQLAALSLNVDYDDGFVAYLNGVEVARSFVDPRQTSSSPASKSHGAGTYESFDASNWLPLLHTGTNVLAIEGHNVAIDGTDFFLDAELVATADAPGGPPHAVMHTFVRTANAPARIHFSSGGSFDEDGPLAALLWDFGDGTDSPSSVPEIDHVYTAPGTYLATLVVRDG